MRRAAWSPPSATIAGTTIEAATAAEILGVLVGSTTVSWPPLHSLHYDDPKILGLPTSLHA
jgi:hypothetical protein